LIAESAEYRFAQLHREYCCKSGNATVTQYVIASLSSTAMALLTFAHFGQRFPHLNTVRHEACGFLDRMAFMLSSVLTLMGDCSVDILKVHDPLHFLSVPRGRLCWVFM
jgi:hypothetical protein